jgi:hypothetical protein
VLNEAGFAMDPLSDEALESITQLLAVVRRHEGDFAEPAVEVGSGAGAAPAASIAG